jgi:uncharacterized protein (DUF362 family)
VSPFAEYLIGKIVLAGDSVAADFTCARLMGLVPNRVWHQERAARLLANGSPNRIDLIEEKLATPPRCCRHSPTESMRSAQ